MLPAYFLLLLMPSIWAAPQKSNNSSGVELAIGQARNFQAKARLASCQHAVSVLILQGAVKLQNGSMPSANGSTSSEAKVSALHQLEQQLQQSAATLKKAHISGIQPSTGTILQCIALYSDAYEQVNNGADSGITTPSTEAEITAAIGVMMRRTSALQASLEASA